jgi:hypothetical protein
MQSLVQHKAVRDLNLTSKVELGDACEECIYGSTSAPVPQQSMTTTTHPLELVHS